MSSVIHSCGPCSNKAAYRMVLVDPVTCEPINFGGGGGPTTVTLTVTGGTLTATVNGVSDFIQGTLLEDAFGVALGYLLPA
jgi:hypothetical protein